MAKISVLCGFCGQKYVTELVKLPFVCGKCRCMVDLPEREAATRASPRDKHLLRQTPLGGKDRYIVERQLAAGGMGEILLVRDSHLQRQVAMKVLKSEMAKNALGERFIAEAQITGRLEHPNIVPIYDMGDDQGSFFFTMKHIKGKSLSEAIHALKSGKDIPQKSLNCRLQIFQKICQAVAYAHSQGTLHRDLKPDNVMLGKFGEVMLVDWGIAKQRKITEPSKKMSQVDGPGTQFGQMIGTPGYMAPEQARGDLEKIDEQSDIYGLGAVLYELIYLKPPFVAESSLALALKAACASPECPAKDLCGNKISPKLKAIVLKAMALDKNNRYENAQHLEEEIDRFLENRPVLAKKESPWEKFSRMAHVNMVNSMDIGDMVILMLAFLIFGGLLIKTTQMQQRQKHYNELIATATIEYDLGKQSHEHRQNVKEQKAKSSLQREEDRHWEAALWCAKRVLEHDPHSDVAKIVESIERARKEN